MNDLRRLAIAAYACAGLLYFSITVLGRDRSAALAAAEGAIEQGNLVRSAIVAFLAGGTVLLLLGRAGVPLRAMLLWLPYLAFSTLTLAWSPDPMLSLRRLVIVLVVVVTGLVAGRAFFSPSTGQSRMMGAFTAAGAAALVAVALRIARDGPGTAWRAIVGTGELNGEGLGLHAGEPLVLGMLASVVYMGVATDPGRAQRRRLLMVSMIVSTLLFLVILKVRFLLATATVALAVLIPRSLAWEVRMTLLALLVVAAAIMFSFANVAVLTQSGLGRWATQDQSSEYLASLSGRTDLWEAAWDLGTGHRWLGLGFGAVWTPTALATVAARTGFKAVHAHNGFLDELLATGVVGLVLFMLPLAVLFRQLLRDGKIRESSAFGLVVLVLFCAWNLTDSILQNYLDFCFLAVALLTGAVIRDVHPPVRSV